MLFGLQRDLTIPPFPSPLPESILQCHHVIDRGGPAGGPVNIRALGLRVSATFLVEGHIGLIFFEVGELVGVVA